LTHSRCSPPSILFSLHAGLELLTAFRTFHRFKSNRLTKSGLIVNPHFGQTSPEDARTIHINFGGREILICSFPEESLHSLLYR
jgi:hypothetical protein